MSVQTIHDMPLVLWIDIRERIAQHETNLQLWESGYLTPTEPDPQEREIVQRELRAAIAELKWVLAGITKGTP
jgi:hypothetical protein